MTQAPKPELMERLRRGQSWWRNPDGPEAADRIEHLQAQLSAAQAENEALREALEPFAGAFEKARDRYIRRYGSMPTVGADNFDAMPDAWKMDALKFTMGDFRRARQALGGTQ